MQVRINNIECRLRDDRYEIIKWYPNSYYNQLRPYLLDGWYIKEGFVCKGNIKISRSAFDNKESCFTVAWLELNTKEPDVNLISVGSRLLSLEATDRQDFWEVYELANQKLQRFMTANEGDEEPLF